jgi:hypothetical protein
MCGRNKGIVGREREGEGGKKGELNDSTWDGEAMWEKA